MHKAYVLPIYAQKPHPIEDLPSITLTSRVTLDPTQEASANTSVLADRREFIKISQAVGMGFLIMGAIGYVIKLIHIPVNNILVGGA